MTWSFLHFITPYSLKLEHKIGSAAFSPSATPTAALAVSSLAEEASVNRLGSGSGFLKGGTRVLRVTQGGEIGRGEVKDEKKKSINWM